MSLLNFVSPVFCFRSPLSCVFVRRECAFFFLILNLIRFAAQNGRADYVRFNILVKFSLVWFGFISSIRCFCFRVCNVCVACACEFVHVIFVVVVRSLIVYHSKVRVLLPSRCSRKQLGSCHFRLATYPGVCV